MTISVNIFSKTDKNVSIYLFWIYMSHTGMENLKQFITLTIHVWESWLYLAFKLNQQISNSWLWCRVRKSITSKTRNTHTQLKQLSYKRNNYYHNILFMSLLLFIALFSLLLNSFFHFMRLFVQNHKFNFMAHRIKSWQTFFSKGPESKY